MKVIDTLYDRYWEPKIRQFENWNLVSFQGVHVWFIYENKLYNYKWKHVWWIEGWILRDLRGLCVWFWKHVTDNWHPLLPIKQIPPIPSIVQIPPIKPIREIPRIKPIKSLQWSDHEPLDLFLNWNK